MPKSMSTRVSRSIGGVVSIAALAFGSIAIGQPITRLSVTPAPDETTVAAQLGYIEPQGAPTGRRYIQPTPLANALSTVLRNARDIGASTLSVEDEDGDALVAVYLGDPGRYVDCGVIVATTADGQESRIDAASNAVTFTIDRPTDETALETKRWMLIAARTTIRMERRAGPPFFAIAQSTYVMTKIVSAREAGGDFVGRSVETISFNSGAAGVFEKGTECRPTGELEQKLLANL